VVFINILGLNTLLHDVGCGLITNNTINYAIEEERLSRIKHHEGFLFGGGAPELSMNKCLKKINYKIENVAFGWDVNYFKSLKLFYGNLYNLIIPLTNKRLLNESSCSIFKLFFYYKRYFDFVKKIKRNIKNVYFVPHHLAHSASVYRTSGYKKCNVLVLDASGEKSSISLYIGKKGSLQLFKDFQLSSSIGNLYHSVTRLISMGYYGEGKTMGLAPYGKVDKKFELIQLNKNNFKIDYHKLLRIAILLNKKNSLELKRNIAATLQAELEETTLMLAEQLYEQTGYKNLCVAGGVALNCKMNSALLNSDFVNNIYTSSAPHDAGVALGAALEVAIQQGHKFNILNHAYLGPKYSKSEIEMELKKSNLKFEYYSDIEGIAAELISEGYIIGWFQGRMEFGPRALGNRSILANPTNPKIADKVNDIKHRERWRPLAPSILEEKVGKYFEKPYPSPFMSLTFQVKKEKQKEIPAVTHIDGSARVQTVNRRSNPQFYKLIKEFKKLSGVPLVLNTSFNDKDEPIVMSPKDAIASYKNMALDFLIIGNYLVKKNG